MAIDLNPPALDVKTYENAGWVVLKLSGGWDGPFTREVAEERAAEIAQDMATPDGRVGMAWVAQLRQRTFVRISLDVSKGADKALPED